MWETVSAFSNTEGGIILGIKEKKTADGSVYVVNGVLNPEQMELDIITTLRSRTKFNAPVSDKAMRYKIDCKDILAFERCKNIGVGVMLGAENYALATSHSV